MAIETDIERLMFLVQGEFAESATYQKADTTQTTILGIFDDEYLEQDAGTGVAFICTEPKFMCRTSDIPAGAAEDDFITVAGTTYLVKVFREDGTGMTDIMLEET